MENIEIKLNDISDDLFIMSKTTVDILFKQDNCADLIALYSFYYKTAKWQKTNSIKANDIYCRKCLNWGASKLTKTKKQLKKLGLINLIQRRKDGKVCGWFIEVGYLVSESKKNISTQEHSDQQHSISTSRNEETNALRNKVKVLEELNNNMLKEIKELKKNKKEVSIIQKNIKSDKEIAFDNFYSKYPKKVGKEAVRKKFLKLKDDEIQKILDVIDIYPFSKDKQYIPHPATWINQKRWQDEFTPNEQPFTQFDDDIVPF